MDSMIQMLGGVNLSGGHVGNVGECYTSIMMPETAQWLSVANNESGAFNRGEVNGLGGVSDFVESLGDKVMALPMPIKVGAGLAALAGVAWVLSNRSKKRKRAASRKRTQSRDNLKRLAYYGPKMKR